MLLTFRRDISTILAASIPLAATPLAGAALVRFELLDQSASANDLSPDGRWIVGDADDGSGGYRWSRDTGYTFVGGGGAVAVSDDGSVVLGLVFDPASGNEAAVWNAADGWTQIPPPPGASGCNTFVNPYELSGDGAVAVGRAWEVGACLATGFRWTSAGTLATEVLANGNNRASVVSGDGALIGGFAQGAFNRTPAIWTADGSGQLLDPPDGEVIGEVRGISDDGAILLGEWDGKAFAWDQSSTIEIFDGTIQSWNANAMDIADDGTIVGFDNFQTARRAWIRRPGEAALDLRNHLIAQGATGLPPVLEVCQAISIDGNVVIGHNAFLHGWIVNLCAADLSRNDAVETADLLQLLGAWGACAGDCLEDFNGDGSVDVSDLLLLLAEWGECP